MADDAGADTKKRRGRPAKPDTGDKPKAEKRKADGESGPAAKKGRGRPKGSGGGRKRKSGKKASPKKVIIKLLYALTSISFLKCVYYITWLWLIPVLQAPGRGGGRGRPKKAVAEEPDKSEQSSGAEQGEDE